MVITLAVVDAIKRKKALLEEGEGPVLLETITTAIPDIPLPMLHPTLEGRDRRLAAIDPLVGYANELIAAGLLSEEAIDQEGGLDQGDDSGFSVGFRSEVSSLGLGKDRGSYVLEEEREQTLS